MMSNSSEANRITASEDLAPGPKLSNLLMAISEELAVLTAELSRLGEHLSNEALERNSGDTAYDLQAFDIITQMAAAQARLLRRLARGDAGPGGANIKALIDEIPFAAARRRLGNASHAPASPLDESHEDDSSVSLF